MERIKHQDSNEGDRFFSGDFLPEEWSGLPVESRLQAVANDLLKGRRIIIREEETQGFSIHASRPEDVEYLTPGVWRVLAFSEAVELTKSKGFRNDRSGSIKRVLHLVGEGPIKPV